MIATEKKIAEKAYWKQEQVRKQLQLISALRCIEKKERMIQRTLKLGKKKLRNRRQKCDFLI